MVSFIDVAGRLVSSDRETIHENLILASYGKNNYRSDGVIRIGSIDPETNAVTWLNDDTVRFPKRYNYSCLTQLTDCDSNADFAVLYEQDDTTNPKGVMAMHFVKLTAADLMGEGWTLETPVTLSVDTALVDLDLGGRKTVKPEYSPADATVEWSSSDESVVTAENGVITAVGAGSATVTLTVRKDGFARVANIPVLIQPEDDIVLPEQYRSKRNKTVTPESASIELVELTEQEALAEGTYFIYNGSSHVLHNNTNTGRLDRCGASASNKLLTPNVAHVEHDWLFTKQQDGKFSISNGGKYLTDEASLSATPVGGFTVTCVGGTCRITSDSGKLFVYSTSWAFSNDATTTIQLFERHTTPVATTYTITVDGLEALIRATERDRSEYAELLAKAGETYDNEAAAIAAQTAVDEAAKPLYAELREEDLPRYLVTYTVQGELLAVQSYYAGEVIVPMTDPVRSGYVFTGWTGMPEDKRMPEHDLDLVAAFRAISSGSTSGGGGSSRPDPVKPTDEDQKQPEGQQPETPGEFGDIPAGHWAAEAVRRVADLGLLRGTGEGRFEPAVPMTRASLATVLYRLADSEEQGEADFADVQSGAWYADAVAWAAKNGVVSGVADDVFAPDQSITREQLAVMLARYAKLVGLNTKADAKSLDKFADGDKTGAWAVDGVAWCVENGILKGKGRNDLDPTADVTRAEVAVMLDRFIALLK